MSPTKEIKFVTPRSTIEIHLPCRKVLSGKRNLPVGNFLKIIDDPDKAPIVGAVVNGSLRELTYPITKDSDVRPVTMASADGMRFYRRSLTYLLQTTFEELFPEAILTIDHSVYSGGYFCQIYNHKPLSSRQISILYSRMKEIVEEDVKFVRKEIPIDEAIEFFKKKGYSDKVRLLAHRKKPHLVIYQLKHHQDYHHGYMVPSTGYLKWFDLTKTGDGITLRFPRRHKPKEILPLPKNPILIATFRQYGDWLQRLGIGSVGSLNDAIVASRSKEVILVSEALHELRIAEIASQISEKVDQIRVVLIAGPSSSGKTSFARRLSIQLLANGISPYPLEMDNYFVDRLDTPLDEDGELDFESIYALDRVRLNNDFSKLINGEPVQIPDFDFKSGKRAPGSEIQLLPGQIIILEGIHGLNPELISDIPRQNTFRIYASALTQLNLDRYNRVSTTDTRLIRRIVRDAKARGYSAEDTISRWESVRRGEKRYIFPYQWNADVMFNSALVYELSALKPLAEPLLRQVPLGTTEHIEAKRLLSFLEWFIPISNDLIPDNSILKEFIGKSSLTDFKIWQSL